MMGSFLTRALLMMFGYVYPAYKCYKTVENRNLEIDKLKFWCQYWILVALFTVHERISDGIISWLPLYDEAKLALVLYLWHPKTRGTLYIYSSFLQPYLVKHEKKIDLNLMNMKNEAVIRTTFLWQDALNYGQHKFIEALQYVSMQSTSKCRVNQELPDDGK